MSEKSIYEQIIDEFISSIKGYDIISESILKELKKSLEEKKTISKRDFISLLSSEE